MPGNSHGQLFKVTTYGESHGEAIGCIIDGCPPNLKIDIEDIQRDLDRRKPGKQDILLKEENQILLRYYPVCLRGNLLVHQ